ncbi:polysulfide reductase NrfD [Janibacter sp. YIM B02568]|uniref:NrfD/PsrC family molybdoenzyme membrane anchor subunit n=1 Tax=Janibacter endophyticus TaxID=2806261 RepID=UPI00194FF854|nr:NrfD/PsrC family molybdoenzyme membrane anchor subunit [Janibacter endophyticus]MBM6544832.1 polysulfide reductase NrfD [Janibacter endophyticus]
MSTSAYDAYRDPDTTRRGSSQSSSHLRNRDQRRRRDPAVAGAGSGRREGSVAARANDWLTGGGRGRGERAVVPEAQFSSYYGQPVVKPMPWKHEIPAYLFLGGVAASSGMIGAGAHAIGHEVLRRNARLTSMVAVGLSGGALIMDLGRPERFINMLRTMKLTSPMSVGTWIFSGFSAFAGLSTAAELDRMLGGSSGGKGLPVVGGLLRTAEPIGSLGSFAFGPPLAAYTAVLLSDTATPLWFESRRSLPFVFVSSASMAASGIQMALTPTRETAPVRRLAMLGAAGDFLAVEAMEKQLKEVGVVEPLHHGTAGRMMKTAKVLTVAGGVGSLLAGRSRVVAVASGLALAAASALTRFAVVEAGIESAKDPRYTVGPQKARLAERRQQGLVHDSITTAH